MFLQTSANTVNLFAWFLWLPWCPSFRWFPLFHSLSFVSLIALLVCLPACLPANLLRVNNLSRKNARYICYTQVILSYYERMCEIFGLCSLSVFLLMGTLKDCGKPRLRAHLYPSTSLNSFYQLYPKQQQYNTVYIQYIIIIDTCVNDQCPIFSNTRCMRRVKSCPHGRSTVHKVANVKRRIDMLQHVRANILMFFYKKSGS